MHRIARLSTLTRNHTWPIILRSFTVCLLTSLGFLAVSVPVAYGQSEFPIYPKYQVLGIVYAPPGAASSVTYGNSNMVGSSHSTITNSTYDTVQTTSQTTGFNLFGFGDSTTNTTVSYTHLTLPTICSV